MLSSTAEYALRIMIVLTESKGSPTSEQIAAETKVPADYAVKVLQMLARKGLVTGRRGRGGGFKIDCDSNKTSLLDVVNAIDPIQRITVCPLDRESHSTTLCPLHARIDEVMGFMEDGFRGMTLQSVVEGAPGATLCDVSKNGQVDLTVSGQ